jgi:two-component system chemotaxis response regulator CheY
VFSSIDPQPSEDSAAMFAKSCLITDDSPTIRRVARKILTSLGFEVDEAENGQVALEKCRSRMPDLVLLDWNMPVMDGLEFVRALRGTEGGNLPAVVFCTTESDIQHIQLAIDSGADDYIMKPFDRDSLVTKIAGVLRER